MEFHLKRVSKCKIYAATAKIKALQWWRLLILGVGDQPFTFGVMLCVMQNWRCVRMLSMLWKACCRVVLRYFCMARAIGANMACAASRGSMISRGCLGDDETSSSFRRLMCVKASSTATTNLQGGMNRVGSHVFN